MKTLKQEFINRFQIEQHDVKFDSQDITCNDVDKIITQFFKFLKRKKNCGTFDDSGQLPMPPDLINIDLD
jgi:hypothetical protein